MRSSRNGNNQDDSTGQDTNHDEEDPRSEYEHAVQADDTIGHQDEERGELSDSDVEVSDVEESKKNDYAQEASANTSPSTHQAGQQHEKTSLTPSANRNRRTGMKGGLAVPNVSPRERVRRSKEAPSSSSSQGSSVRRSKDGVPLPPPVAGQRPASTSGNIISPGVYAVRGRAFGLRPAWAFNRQSSAVEVANADEIPTAAMVTSNRNLSEEVNGSEMRENLNVAEGIIIEGDPQQKRNRLFALIAILLTVLVVFMIIVFTVTGDDSNDNSEDDGTTDSTESSTSIPSVTPSTTSSNVPSVSLSPTSNPTESQKPTNLPTYRPSVSSAPTVSSAPSTSVRGLQELILTEFFIEFHGGGWKNNENWITTQDVCDWYGIKCNNNTKGEVTHIDLSDNDLRLDGNVFPSGLSEIKTLEYLDLSRNENFTIPSELCNKELYNITGLIVVNFGVECPDECTCVDSPTDIPSATPSTFPTGLPSYSPTLYPSPKPSVLPTSTPSSKPTSAPTSTLSLSPSYVPTVNPSFTPTKLPSISPSHLPTASSTVLPSDSPTKVSSRIPTFRPSLSQSNVPSNTVSGSPSVYPLAATSDHPTSKSSTDPTLSPTSSPSFQPTAIPSVQPTVRHSERPTVSPSGSSSSSPSTSPTTGVSMVPTNKPTYDFSDLPTIDRSIVPSEGDDREDEKTTASPFAAGIPQS